MCALQEHNCLSSNKTRLTDNALLNMALMHSLQCVSDQVLSDCINPNFRITKLSEELISVPSLLKENNPAVNVNNVSDRKLNSKDCKSFYKSKICKYSFIASDYTSAEGQKLLNIKVFQKPPESDISSNMKGKHFLSKRSISEYFLSRNHSMEKDVQPEKGNENSLINMWHRTFFKSQVVIPPPVKEIINCDASLTQDLCQDSALKDPVTVADIVLLPQKNASLIQKKLNQLDGEQGVSGSTSGGVEENQYIQRGQTEEHISQNYSLNPNVNFKVFDIESLSESGELCDSGSVESNAHFMFEDAWFIPSAHHTITSADISGSTSAAQLSLTSSFGESNLPICKICHTAEKPGNALISPCRCIGTLQYIHTQCLMRWLDICKRKSSRPTCELCKYQFHWHKKFKVGKWQFPHCSWQDKILHTVFFISLLVMIGCGAVTVQCFKQHKNTKPETIPLELTESEIVTLICGALFFFALFLALYVEIKARHTVYKLVMKFIYLNQQWYITEYREKGNDVIDV